ncbi:hypothetical protein AB2L27_01325 [Kineococcus sp. LSe6-4]|uniref:Uncharacterized protein n=1 Tax=Kineococcus halophytocola TaxID=3234027 RepID=A0ABV4GYX8_9ACTN
MFLAVSLRRRAITCRDASSSCGRVEDPEVAALRSSALDSPFVVNACEKSPPERAGEALPRESLKKQALTVDGSTADE